MSLDAPTADTILPDDLSLCHAMIRELLARLHKQGHELDGVRFRLDQLLRRLYGRKSERRPDQPELFDEPDANESSETPSVPDPPANDSAPQRRRGHGRRRLPADLERRRVTHDLPDADKICPCCQKPRIVIGEEVSEQLDYQPATAFVWQHVRLTYACPACLANACAASPDTPDANPQAVEPSQPEPAVTSTGAIVPTPVDPLSLIVTAPKPPQPIDKGLPGPGLLAHVVTCKYADHLPLHRQEAILARHGVELSRQTLCGWMAAAANLLTPLYALMLSQALKSRVVQTDETRVPVQDKDQDKTKAGRLWVYVGDRDHPFTVYDYRPDKSRDGPADILKSYRGYLQADAANVFDGLYVPDTITEVGCWAHARRKFHEARDSDAARSAEAIARIGGFYAIEKEAAEQIERLELDGDAADALRVRLRQEKTLPKLIDFAGWLQEQAPIVLPKSPMGQAIAYAQRHWAALSRFTEHGFLNIDNNAAERALRPVAVGRKNWLFAGSDRGGQTAAVLFTMTQTCKRHGIDPFVYLRDALTRLPALPADRLNDLLPNRWAAAQRQQLANPT
jgi:transposase